MIIIIFLMGIIRKKDLGIIIIFIREVLEEVEGLIEVLIIEVDIIIIIIIVVVIIIVMGILIIVNAGEKILIDYLNFFFFDLIFGEQKIKIGINII